MLRRLRHNLRMIRYYSAPRHDTAWSRAADVALWITLLLALPAAWITDVATARPRIVLATSGLFLGESEGHLRAWALTDKTIDQEPPADTTYGRWRLHVIDVHRGWPVTTSIHRLPSQLDLDIFNEPKERTNAQLSDESPLRIALASELESTGQTEMLAAWTQSESQSRYHWKNWVIAAGGWWIGLVVVSLAGIQMTKLATFYIRDRIALKRHSRAAEGKCAQCGYDLTGLEFSERCPECGALVW
jgi:hypothetical protein